MSDYNGWTNRETWLINVWFNPESPDDIDAIQEQFEADYDALPDYMRDFVDISAINWYELREYVTDDDDEDEDDDDEEVAE